MSHRLPAILFYVGVILIANFAASAAEKTPRPDLSAFPKLSGKLKQLLGHEGGFLRPTAGQSFRLDLAALDKLGRLGRLDFDSDEKSYIPLPGPVSVEAIQYYGNGAFRSMRLISKAPAPGNGRVVIDISSRPGAGKGPKHTEVWVLIENDHQTMGVALIECSADGDFPGRAK